MFKMNRSSKVEPSEEMDAAAKNIAHEAPPAPVAPFKSSPASEASGAQARPEVPRPATTRAVSESEALARDIKEGVLSGFVGGSTKLTGEANFKGMLRIDGRFTGQINSEKGTLIVSTGGHVEADIEVAEARINGTIHGDITASVRIEFGRSAQVFGNIKTPALVIEDGAIFEGSCFMNQQRSVTDKSRGSETRKVQEMRAAPHSAQTEQHVAATAPSAHEIAS
ncbi:MAG: polymer-forming cytoskeletal protein [Pyrinomonadaceae bacterium]